MAMIADREGPLLSLVVAVARNGVIGARGGLPWRIQDDLRWFRRMTLGKPVIMGRRTFESIGGPLPERENIVVTGAPPEVISGENGIAFETSIDNALLRARALATAQLLGEACVIGGGAVYAQTLPLADRIYWTEVLADVDGETTFPAFDPSHWRKVRVGYSQQSKKNEFGCEYFILDRIKYADA